MLKNSHKIKKLPSEYPSCCWIERNRQQKYSSIVRNIQHESFLNGCSSIFCFICEGILEKYKFIRVEIIIVLSKRTSLWLLFISKVQIKVQKGKIWERGIGQSNSGEDSQQFDKRGLSALLCRVENFDRAVRDC